MSQSVSDQGKEFDNELPMRPCGHGHRQARTAAHINCP
jgi:hypothetical protein